MQAPEEATIATTGIKANKATLRPNINQVEEILIKLLEGTLGTMAKVEGILEAEEEDMVTTLNLFAKFVVKLVTLLLTATTGLRTGASPEANKGN